MKLYWGKDRKLVVLVAETRAEKAFCDLIISDFDGQKDEETETMARYTIRPEELSQMKHLKLSKRRVLHGNA